MELKKEQMRKILFIALAVVFFYWVLQNNEKMVTWIHSGLGLLAPIILGGAMAFIINIPMSTMEKKIFKKLPSKIEHFRRSLSLVTALVLIVSVIVLVMIIIIPELVRTVLIIKDSIPGFIAQLQETVNTLLVKFPDLADQSMLKIDWADLGKKLFEWIQQGATILAGSTFSAISATFSGVFTFVVGFVLAIYVLLQKETLGQQIRKVCYAYGKESRVDEFLRIMGLANKAFRNFFTGQCLEAVIIGILFFVTMTLAGFPYALMISVTIGFTALIPIFGAFLGCFVGIFLIVVTAPGQTLWFVVLFLVLQQVEGNLIYPRVVGTSVGLPGIWVLIAVTLGGNLFGVLGMLVMVPVCSVVYALLGESTHRRLRIRNISEKKIKA